ncbi:NAD(P)H-binding protein [Spongiivirga sp. MCCC 1A20706]|uniref:NAD(P)H-binding protein n=1 Tax=Spongiivirga sp. MCCC 1A20706 TaxID=3160963 RepID=UPI003977BEF8
MKKTAIILGATGLTGSFLLKQLLIDDRYNIVKVFSRRTLDNDHPKIKEYIVDLFRLEEIKEEFTADEVFCCIGTTAKKTPDKILYKKIDFGIPVTAAGLAAKNQVSTFIVMSSMGANANSSVFYNRIKGEMENAIIATGIKNTFIVRPSLIGGYRNESRPGEYFGKMVFKFLSPLMVGFAKKYRIIHPKTIATAMIHLANNKYKKHIVLSDSLQELGS